MKKKILNEKLESLISKIALEGTKGKGSITGLTAEDKEALLIALRKARDFDSLQEGYRDLVKLGKHPKGERPTSIEKRKEKIALADSIEEFKNPSFYPLDQPATNDPAPGIYELIDQMILKKYNLKRLMGKKAQAKLSRDEQNKIDIDREIHDGYRNKMAMRFKRANEEREAAYERGDLYPSPEWWEFGLELIYKEIIESEKNWD